jgi:hypothetical protein
MPALRLGFERGIAEQPMGPSTAKTHLASATAYRRDEEDSDQEADLVRIFGTNRPPPHRLPERGRFWSTSEDRKSTN